MSALNIGIHFHRVRCNEGDDYNMISSLFYNCNRKTGDGKKLTVIIFGTFFIVPYLAVSLVDKNEDNFILGQICR